MNRFGLVVLAAFSTGSATAAVAQDHGYSSYVYPAGNAVGSDESLNDRLSGYRRIVAKKTLQDGGTLTSAHEKMLNLRLRRIFAEDYVRRHVTEPGING